MELMGFFTGFVEGIFRVLDASERIYWLSLLVSAVIAGAMYLAERPDARAHPGRLLRYLFGGKIWLHRSALLDYRLIIANALLRTVLVTPWALSAFGIAVWLVGELQGLFGAPPPLELAPPVIVGAYSLILFVTWDLSRYVLHRLLHRVPLLWQFHQVHHSAEVLTPFTLLRVHPVESILYSARGALVTGLVTGVFFFLFQESAVQGTILGVNAIGFLFNLLGGNLRHSQIWLSYGPRLERFLLSPAQHQIHHSSDPAHFDKNLGTWLAVWDGWGGTLRLAGPRTKLSFGLSPEVRNHGQTVAMAWFGPFLACGRLLARRNRKSPTGVSSITS
jgi:sterol desaturase/sphingolipid hydroxylase (fatty acid hydroxylase superfamily)